MGGKIYKRQQAFDRWTVMTNAELRVQWRAHGGSGGATSGHADGELTGLRSSGLQVISGW